MLTSKILVIRDQDSHADERRLRMRSELERDSERTVTRTLPKERTKRTDILATGKLEVRPQAGLSTCPTFLPPYSCERLGKFSHKKQKYRFDSSQGWRAAPSLVSLHSILDLESDLPQFPWTDTGWTQEMRALPMSQAREGRDRDRVGLWSEWGGLCLEHVLLLAVGEGEAS